MISKTNSLKKDEENQDLIDTNHILSQQGEYKNSENSLIIKCIQSNTYCLSLMDFMKKLLHISQIDFYSAYVQLLYCFQPQELYSLLLRNELARIRKHLKNQWARDDPGFLIVIAINMFITVLSYCIYLCPRFSVSKILIHFLTHYFLYFILLGFLLSQLIR